MFEFLPPNLIIEFQSFSRCYGFFNCLLSSLTLTLSLNLTLSNYIYKEEEKEEASKHQNNGMGRSK